MRAPEKESGAVHQNWCGRRRASPRACYVVVLKAPRAHSTPWSWLPKHRGRMNLCTYLRADGAARAGVWTERGIVDLQAADRSLPKSLIALLALGDEGLARARAAAESAPAGAIARREAVRLLPPIPNPAKIVCIGLNYRDHAAEVKLPLP